MSQVVGFPLFLFSVFDRVWLFDEQFERTTGWSSVCQRGAFHPSSAANYLIDQNIPRKGDVMIIGNLMSRWKVWWGDWPTIWLIRTLPRRLLFLNWTGPWNYCWIIICRVCIEKKCVLLFQMDLNGSSSKSNWNTWKREMEEEFWFFYYPFCCCHCYHLCIMRFQNNVIWE